MLESESNEEASFLPGCPARSGGCLAGGGAGRYVGAQSGGQLRQLSRHRRSCGQGFRHGSTGRRRCGEDATKTAKTLQKLHEFKSGVRPATVMQQIVKGYTDEELALIVGYLARQK